jgi:4-diphosphocytidyl-2-C-methyl-D-erythritol kinase
VVVAKPPLNVSTSEVYGKLKAAEIRRHPDTAGVLEAVRTGDFHRLCSSLGNVLEEVTLELHPEVKQLKEVMKRLGAEGVLMSGSGPTVFGLVAKQTKAERVYNGLRGFCKEVYAVRMLI